MSATRVDNPMSEYPFSFDELSRFIRPDGPMAAVVDAER